MDVFIVAGAFVALGVGFVALAMRGAPSTAIRRAGPSRDSRRATTIGVTIVVAVMGIALPLVVVLHNEDSGAAQAGGEKLSAGEQEGRHLFADRCATCHALEDASAVGQVGPDLDVLHPQASLTVDAIVEGRARGYGQMPAGLLAGEDAANVADYIERVAGR